MILRKENLGSPLLLPLIPTIAGNLLSNWLYPYWVGFALIGLFCLYLAWKISSWHHYLLGFAFMCLGIISNAINSHPIFPTDLRNNVPPFPAMAKVKGKIGRIVRINEYENFKEKIIFIIATEKIEIRNHNEWMETRGELKVVVPSKLIGETPIENKYVLVHGTIRPIKKNSHTNIFHTHQSPVFELVVNDSGHCILYEPSNQSSKLVAGHIKKNSKLILKENLKSCLPYQNNINGFLVNLGLGDKSELKNSSFEIFLKTGTIHLFAISGLHVGLIALFVVRGLNFFIRLKRPAYWLSIPIIWTYIYYVDHPASSIRAGIMTTIILLALCLNRPIHWPNALHFACLSYILIWPGGLYEIGFMLSFSIVFWLIFLGSQLNKYLSNRTFRDPLLPIQLIGKRTKIIDKAMNFILNGLWISTVCWLGSLPLCSIIFGYVPLTGLLLNIIFIPLTGICLLGLMLGWMFFLLSPFIAENFFHVSWLSMHSMVNSATNLMDMPLMIPQNNSLILWLCYWILLLCLGFLGKCKNKIFYISWATAMAVLLVFIFWIPEDKPDLTIHLTNYQGSHSIIIDRKNQPHLVFDCGNNAHWNHIQRSFNFNSEKPFNMVFRHASSLQMGAFSDLLSEELAKAIYYDSVSPFKSQTWVSFKKNEQSDYASVIYPISQFSDSHCQLMLPHAQLPESTYPTRAHDRPVCVKFSDPTLDGIILFFPSMSVFAQHELLPLVKNQKVIGIVCSWSEKTLPLEMWFLKELSPEWIIVADSQYPTSFWFKDKQRSEWYQILDPHRIFRHSEHGNLRIVKRNSNWSIEGDDLSVPFSSNLK